MSSDRRSNGRRNLAIGTDWPESKLRDHWERLREKVQVHNNSHEHSPCDSCMLWTGSRQNGYPALSLGHARSKLKVHILAAWTRHCRFPGSSEVVSHLCHRKLCINPAHLVIESINSNNARKSCLAFLKDRQGIVWNCCCHKPKCLIPDRKNNGGFVPTSIIHPEPA